MKVRKILVLCIIIILLISTLSACVPGNGTNSDTNLAGFFSGIWHGWIAPFSLIYSIFNKDIGIYEINNNGFAYNLGYYMAIISGFGSLALSRKRGRSKDGKNEE